MSKKFISSLLSGAVLFTSSSAFAAQIDAAVNVDNRFMVVVSQNGVNTVVYTAPSNYTWGREATRFSFNIKDDDLKQCRISLINWGDGAVAEGFAGVFKGANGIVYSGGSGWKTRESSIPNGGMSPVPSQNTVNAIVPATGNGFIDLGSTQNNPRWGSVRPFYTTNDFGGSAIPSNFNWIRPSGTNTTTKNHFVYTTECSNLVNPAPVAVNMPGEHFQCYSLEKGDRIKTERVVVKDQFGKSEVVLGKPRMLCNPSAKVHNGKEFRIRNEKRHLVCYDYVRQSNVKSYNLRINNQFAPDDVVSTKREMFCVPSSKEHMDKIENKQLRYDRRDIRKRPEPRQQRR